MNTPNRVPWVNVAVGILVLISTFVLPPSAIFVRYLMIVTGIVIAIMALAELLSYGRTQRMNYWPLVNVVLGIWLFIMTTWLAGDVPLIWSNIVLGVITIVAALVALSYERLHVTHQIETPRSHLRT